MTGVMAWLVDVAMQNLQPRDSELQELWYHHEIPSYRDLSEADCAALRNNLLCICGTVLDFQVPLWEGTL